MFVIGLTGGIGSGKTLVGESFSQLGIEVINADIAARQVVEKGSSALIQIANHFGRECLQDDGSLDRAFLRAHVFNNPEDRQWLESLLHPLIREWIQLALSHAKGPYAILETPLLLETNQQQLTDRILVVDIPESLQVARASERDNNNEEQIRAIIKAQLPRQERLTRADDILDNSGTLDQLADQVAKLHRKYLALARHKTKPKSPNQ